MVTLQRLLPPAEELVHQVLAECGVDPTTTPPANLASQCPALVAYRFGGAAVHPEFLDRATIQVIAFDTSNVGARDLAETCRVLLWQAWRSQFTSELGTVHRSAEVSSPTRLLIEGVPDGVFRWDATYTVWTRPASS